MIIIGIDPGSRLTGFGIIRIEGNQSFYLNSGCLRATDKHLATRLQSIFNGLQDVIHLYQPAEAAIEQVFMHTNPNAALKLGQARGVAIAALNIPIAEYTARQIKQSVVGYGAAKKEQVQHMVKRLLNVAQNLQADAADALAVALCHAHSRSNLFSTTGSVSRSKRNSWRRYSPGDNM